ncbi:hypothetical protein E1180_12045 [Roseibium denhamense]|uniref:Flagellar assembly protein FliH/Type III secretion system HrpE domain-containing protein n=1 Tax=Roseibium denhamense TaxID=76305 RepID=A0ABY1PFQ6_9HYPH|nr:hypothetical protein [Roseibium denhamense]MTI06246.1 hypothetical protein [Roseibium denhamense]SMP32798.1 hypothetical protein SAMN06265374_3601 [Roseibium denhamense]
MAMSAANHIPVLSVPKFKSMGAYDAALVDVIEPIEEPHHEPSEEELRQAEYDRGLAEGIANTKAHYEALLQQERETNEKLLEDERLRFDMRESANVSAAIEGCLNVIEHRVSYSLAKILTPFLEDRITQQLVAAFADNLRQLAEDADGKLIRLRGPESLVNQVLELLPTMRDRIETQIADQVELKALLDETTIETRLQQWLGQLETLQKDTE